MPTVVRRASCCNTGSKTTCRVGKKIFILIVRSVQERNERTLDSATDTQHDSPLAPANYPCLHQSTVFTYFNIF